MSRQPPSRTGSGPRLAGRGRDLGGGAVKAPAELLGEYLPLLADAAINGRRPDAFELDAVRELGRRAAAQGVGARRAVDLYLSAAWRLWRQLPVVVRSSDPEKVRRAAEAVLRVLDDAIGVLVDGHQAERRDDDPPGGDAAGRVRRRPAARRRRRLADGRARRAVRHRPGQAAPRGAGRAARRRTAAVDRAAIVAGTRGGRPVRRPRGAGRHEGRPRGRRSSRARPHRRRPPARPRHRRRRCSRTCAGCSSPGRWRVAAGRAFPGAYGVARSYEEALRGPGLADRLGLDADVVHARDLLVYRVLGRDQAAMVDLVRDVLAPLEQVRGGAEVLLETLRAYFDAGEVATEAARRLHVSVRTVTYRLARVAQLTGYRVSRARPAVLAARRGARRPAARVARAAAAGRTVTRPRLRSVRFRPDAALLLAFARRRGHGARPALMEGP